MEDRRWRVRVQTASQQPREERIFKNPFTGKQFCLFVFKDSTSLQGTLSTFPFLHIKNMAAPQPVMEFLQEYYKIKIICIIQYRMRSHSCKGSIYIYVPMHSQRKITPWTTARVWVEGREDLKYFTSKWSVFCWPLIIKIEPIDSTHTARPEEGHRI